MSNVPGRVNGIRLTWREKLEGNNHVDSNVHRPVYPAIEANNPPIEYCRLTRLPPPNFSLVSDRRGRVPLSHFVAVFTLHILLFLLNSASLKSPHRNFLEPSGDLTFWGAQEVRTQKWLALGRNFR
jgi:hypothetical protein